MRCCSALLLAACASAYLAPPPRRAAPQRFAQSLRATDEIAEDEPLYLNGALAAVAGDAGAFQLVVAGAFDDAPPVAVWTEDARLGPYQSQGGQALRGVATGPAGPRPSTPP